MTLKKIIINKNSFNIFKIIAKEVNISQSYLSRVIKDILNKIKNRLIEEHVIIEKHLK